AKSSAHTAARITAFIGMVPPSITARGEHLPLAWGPTPTPRLKAVPARSHSATPSALPSGASLGPQALINARRDRRCASLRRWTRAGRRRRGKLPSFRVSRRVIRPVADGLSLFIDEYQRLLKQSGCWRPFGDG